ncbi:MAG: hypothetical protein KBS41_04015 [Oscillospiraceae bacterium]|nr:hypothetical protein [Candidatus Equicaccousia limihippi]
MDKYSDNIFDKTLFFEQIVTIPVKAKQLICITLIWLVAIFFCAALLFLSFFFLKPLLAVVILLIAGVVALTIKLCQNFFVEYEYIITQSELDIDKIISRNKRSRIITADLKEASSLCKYDASREAQGVNHVYRCCEKDDKNALALTVHHQSKGRVMIVFAPNEKMLDAIKKKLPAGVCNL